jgi:L-Ala-D/L-Glu epimerase / N-acetyl-D-glutamate racemase
MNVEIRRLRARLRAPFVSASGALHDRDLVLVRLEDAEGHVGVGEAAPLADYHGVDVDDVLNALEAARAMLTDAGPDASHRQVVAEWSQLAPLPALAAVDVAMWDLEARRFGQPLWRILGAHAGRPVEVNATIAAADRAGAASQAAVARADGYRCVKAKVGIGDDAGRLAAVRAVLGPGVAIRLDANGAWSVDEAVANLRALAPVGIELCEEPVHGLEQNREVAATVPEVSIALDETASAFGALEEQVCQAVCLKIAACGGMRGLLRAARRARRSGYEVYLASTLDGPIGIAAALHAAAAIVPDRPCGLATLGLFADRDSPLEPADGRMELPAGPGLGDGLLAWYRSG